MHETRTRKRLNLKFLACLLGGLVLFGALTHFLHGFQVRRNAGSFLKRSDQARAGGDFEKAAEYLSRYVALIPSDTETLGKYGLLLADGEFKAPARVRLRAFLLLDQVLRREPERADVRRRVIRLAMELGRYGDARTHLDHLLARPETQDGALYALRGRCHEADARYGDAAGDYKQAVARAPQEVEAAARLASLLHRYPKKVGKEVGRTGPEKAPAEARKIIDQMVARNPKSFKAYLTRAWYTRQFAPPADGTEEGGRAAAGARRSVTQDVQRALECGPQEVEVVLAAADLAQQNADEAADLAAREADPEKAREARARRASEAQKAKAYLTESLRAHAKDWRLYQALSRIEMKQGEVKGAVETLRKGLKALPKHLDLLWNLAHLLIRSGSRPEAEEVVARLAAEGFSAAELDYLRARLLVVEKDWLKAAHALEGAYPALANRHNERQDWFLFNLVQECNLLLGVCYENLSDADRAATAYGRVVARDPGSVSGRLGVARMQRVLGRLDAAVRDYRQLIKFGNVPPGALVEAAVALLEHNAQLTQPHWAEVEQILDRADALRPRPVEVALLRAEVCAAKNDFDQARTTLVREYGDRRARPAAVWTGMASLAERRGSKQDALALLDEAERYLGDHVELRLARVRYWSRHEGAEAREALARLGQGYEKFKAEDRSRLLRGLAAASARLGDNKQAERLWRRFAELQPRGSLGGRVILFDLAQERGDVAAMGQLVRELQDIEGQEGTLWRYCRACQLVRQAQSGQRGGLDEATGLLEAVASRRPGWAGRVALCQAQVYELQGRAKSAINKYREAIELREGGTAAVRQAVSLLEKEGRGAEIDALIVGLQKEKASLKGLERVEAEVALRKQDTAHALQLARKAVSADSTDYRDHIWFGRMLLAAGQRAEAEAPFRRALALADNVPDTWVGYVQYLVLTGDKDRAEAKIREARAKLPPDKAPLALALCYEMTGQHDRAEPLYQAALKAAPEDVKVLGHVARFALSRKQGEQAKHHLQKIIGLKHSAPQDVAWARRALMQLLAATADDYQQAQKALAILGLLEDGSLAEARAETADGAADLRARALILASLPALQDQKRAVAILEKLQSRQQLSTEEQFLLASRYEVTGDWAKARELTASLLIRLGERLEGSPGRAAQLEDLYRTHLANFALSLLRRKATDEARLWFVKLEKADPRGFPTLFVKAHLLAREGRAAEAVAPLKALAGREPKYLLRVAELLEKVEQFAAAEELLGQYVAQNRAAQPQAVLQLARFLGRRGRTAEALAVCEKAWETCAPEAVGRAAVEALYAARATDEHCRRVAGWLQAQSARAPDRHQLLDLLAAVRRLQGRHDEAVALYRRLLERNKADALTLNNLAWLQALRGEGAEALAAVQRAIDLVGPLGDLLDTRAVVYLALGRARDAVKDLQEAVAETPTAHRYFHLAQAHQAANDRRAAGVALRQARELGLNEGTVDPLEREAYRRVCAELARS